MKKLLIILPLLLIGCGTDSPVNNQVTAVREATVKTCSFLPTVASVTSILTAGDPTVVGVSAVASAICAAVTKTAPQGLFSNEENCPKVNGVCIEGDFVDPDKGK